MCHYIPNIKHVIQDVKRSIDVPIHAKTKAASNSLALNSFTAM
jgi:hypothetical protein